MIAVGGTIAHYRIDEELGSGGMGVVYRAHDLRLDRTVAIKVLSAHGTQDATARERLLREARLTSALSHPNICTVYEVGELGDQVYLVMEWARGQTLSERVSHGPLPVESVVRYGLGIAEALEHAHGHGVIHRDLKGANVVVLPDGRIKVLDFGLARRAERGSGAPASRPAPSGEPVAAARPPSEGGLAAGLPAALRLTAEGMMVGTPFAFAPEVIRGAEADARSDLWALGVLLYEMASGILPFHGRDVQELANAIVYDPAPPLPARIPAGLRTVIQRCLAKSPAERYQGSGEVRAALEALASGEHAAVAVAAPTAAAEAARPRRVPRPLWASLTGALAVVGLVAILNPGFWRDRLGGERSIRSLAVLPLANLSGDPEQEFFADGLTEALITRLAQINGLRVTSRTSVMAYKGTRQPLREIARELGVRAILEGSVIRSGPRVRVTAQLIEAGTDRHLWAESYDRDLADVLAIQDDVTSDIADRIRLELSPEQKGRMKQRGAVNPEVYDLYLKGRYFQNQLNPEALAKAVGFYRQAVAIDPRDARAYSGLADAYSIMTIVLSTTSPEEGWPRVREYAEKALSLDPTLADAHVSIGAYQWLAALRWDDAERELRRAVALDPGYALGRSVLGLMLISTGRTEEGIGEVHRSLDLDSLSMFVAANATWGHFYARKLDEADRHGEQLLRVAPHYRSAHAALRAVALAREDYADAIEHEAATLPDSLAPLFRVRARAALAARGARGYWELERELAPQRGLDRFWPSWIAGVEGHLGNLDAAMQWIERAIVVHDGNLAFLAVDPLYDPLRGDPRFQAVLERLGLKEPAPSERAQRGSAVRRPSKV